MLTLSFVSLWLSLFLFVLFVVVISVVVVVLLFLLFCSCCLLFPCCFLVVSLLFGCCSFVVVVVPLFNIFWAHCCCCCCSCFVVVVVVISVVVVVVVGLLCRKLVLGKMRKLGLLLRPRKVSDLEQSHQIQELDLIDSCNLIRSHELNNQSEVDTSANEKESDLKNQIAHLIFKSDYHY